MTTKVAQGRISRLWLECVELSKQIEQLDPDYKIVLEAKKPENEAGARLGYVKNIFKVFF